MEANGRLSCVNYGQSDEHWEWEGGPIVEISAVLLKALGIDPTSDTINIGKMALKIIGKPSNRFSYFATRAVVNGN